ncbi:hypothetical protein NXF25_020184 [Crotalus adamanteus]|uniref:LRRC37A/B like protein 1 C-terminal domain-containing protein n=1 Tax=Crotalus adamanteus TaxID=8729 RepID=A0AAW1B3X1_CROAD
MTDNVAKKYDIQMKVATGISKASGESSLRTKSPLERLKSHQKIVERDPWLGKNVSHILAEKPRKPEALLDPQESRRENLLRHLIIGGSSSRSPSDLSETLNKLLPEEMLSNEAHWEYQEETTSALLLSDFSSTTDNSLLQGDVFETEVQILLAQLILNERIRNLISHLIRLIKVDCRELTTQNSCGFLISKIGLVMKLYNKRKSIQEASAMVKSSLLLGKNVKNIVMY